MKNITNLMISKKHKTILKKLKNNKVQEMKKVLQEYYNRNKKNTEKNKTLIEIKKLIREKTNNDITLLYFFNKCYKKYYLKEDNINGHTRYRVYIKDIYNNIKMLKGVEVDKKRTTLEEKIRLVKYANRKRRV